MFRQYFVKVDGSGRLTLRNRRHLRPILVPHPTTPVLVGTPPIPAVRDDVVAQDSTDMMPTKLSEPITNAAVSPPASVPMLTDAPPASVPMLTDAPPTTDASPTTDGPPLRRSKRTIVKPVRYR